MNQYIIHVLDYLGSWHFATFVTFRGYRAYNTCYFYIFPLLLHAKSSRNKMEFILKLAFPNSRLRNLHQFPEQMKDINGAIRPRCRLISQAVIASV